MSNAYARLASILALPLVLLSSAWAAPAAPRNVILVVLDGVRLQEFLQSRERPEASALPYFWAQLVNQGTLFGAERLGGMSIANPAGISLPGYQSIMGGFPQPCMDNECGRIKTETVAEKIRRELRLAPEQVATIASWEKIEEAAESVPGATFVNVGQRELADSVRDAELDRINAEQMANPPRWSHARQDRFTFAHAQRYLRVHRPRFMFIALNDSDEYGHLGDHDAYIKTLRQYDEWLYQLQAQLDSMGEYGKQTILMVTTDHGRGAGDDWIHHHVSYPYSKKVFFFAKGPGIRKRGTVAAGFNHSHSDIRPTIEVLMGLKAQECHGCGHPMWDMLKKWF